MILNEEVDGQQCRSFSCFITLEKKRGGGAKSQLWWWWLFPCLQEFWENVLPFLPRLGFILFYFFKWRLDRALYFHSFMPGSVHSGSVSGDECGWVFPDVFFGMTLFPDRFPHYAWTAAQSAHSLGQGCTSV